MKTIFLCLVLMGCGVVDGPAGGDDDGLLPEIGTVYDCDLITEIGVAPYTPVDQIQHIHQISHPCFGSDTELNVYVQAWMDNTCTPMVNAAGPPGGGCYGDCHPDNYNYCSVGQ
jgi:hypothetical protein